MNILVTGGAGYVGSHAARFLEGEGHDVWVYDNISLGHSAAATPSRLVVGDLVERDKLETLLKEKRIDAVMHFAAFANVAESVRNPAASQR